MLMLLPQKSEIDAGVKSVPPAVAGGFNLVPSVSLKYITPIIYPPATAGGTDFNANGSMSLRRSRC